VSGAGVSGVVEASSADTGVEQNEEDGSDKVVY
jgi:hypothetical protein